MAAAPAFQFYAKEFLSGTLRFKLEPLGAYAKLLAWSWDNGPVPKDIHDLASILGVPPAKARTVFAVISSKWKLTKRGYVNQRLEKQRRELRQFSRQQADRGRKSGAARRAKKSNGGSNAGSTNARTGDERPMVEPETNSAVCDLQSADQNQDQDQRADARESHAVLVRLAHAVMEDVESGALAASEAKDELKHRAAKARIIYDARAVTAALDSAEVQRKRRSA